MSIKAKMRRKFVDKRLGTIQNLDNLIPKLHRNPNIKSQDHTSRSRHPDGRTRRSHAPKRVARSHCSAAFPRQFDLIWLPDFVGDFIRDSSPFCTYKYPLQCNVQSVQRRAKGQKLGFRFFFFLLG